VIGLLAMAESGLFVGLVLPGEAAMLLGGLLVFQGRADLEVMLAVCCGAAVAGDSLGYWMGRHAGPRLERTRVGQRIGSERWQRARRYLNEKGGRAVFFGRFVGVLRALVPALAGSARLPFRTFLPYSAAGAVIWVTALVVLGSIAGRSWRLIDQWAGRASLVALVLLALTGTIVVSAKWAARHQQLITERIGNLRRGPRLAPLFDRYSSQIEFFRRRIDPSIRVGLFFTLGILFSIAAASAFGVLLDQVIEGDTQSTIDGPVQRFFVEHRDPTITTVMLIITQFGGAIVVASVLGAAAVVAYIRTRSPRWAAFFSATLIGALALDDVVKFLVGRPRPTASQLVEVSGSAFPSGHATAAAAMCAALAYALTRRSGWRRTVWIWAAGVVVASLVAVSRVYLGVHWLTDVGGGMMLGVFWVAFTSSGLTLWGEVRDRRRVRASGDTYVAASADAPPGN
jgi:membrane protein DedA with SNARE-associated domain/membrane-associated phospholipid phosphatase